jgi:hypothetical protein
MYFSELLNAQNVSDVRQIEIHTTETLAAGPNYLEVEIDVATLSKYN